MVHEIQVYRENIERGFGTLRSLPRVVDAGPSQLLDGFIILALFEMSWTSLSYRNERASSPWLLTVVILMLCRQPEAVQTPQALPRIVATHAQVAVRIGHAAR